MISYISFTSADFHLSRKFHSPALHKNSALASGRVSITEHRNYIVPKYEAVRTKLMARTSRNDSSYDNKVMLRYPY